MAKFFMYLIGGLLLICIGLFVLPFVLIYLFIKEKNPIFLILSICSIFLLFIIFNSSSEDDNKSANYDNYDDIILKEDYSEQDETIENKNDEPEDEIFYSWNATSFNEYKEIYAPRAEEIVKNAGLFREYMIRSSVPYIQIYLYSPVEYDYNTYLESCKSILNQLKELNDSISYNPKGWIKQEIYVNVIFYVYKPIIKESYITHTNYRELGDFQINVRGDYVFESLPWQPND